MPAESPPHEQIPPGTIFEMISGSAIKVLDHTTPPEVANREEGGTVIVSFDDSPHRMEIELLKFQMSVVRKIVDTASAKRKRTSSKLSQEFNNETSTSSDRFASVLEWPGPESDQFPNDDRSACLDDVLSVCRGLTLRRTSNVPQEQCEFKLPKSILVDNPRDARPGVINRGMWDPANGFPFLSWDPYLTVTCEICNIDKDDHQVVICDKCHCGYHTYCVRPGKQFVSREFVIVQVLSNFAQILLSPPYEHSWIIRDEKSWLWFRKMTGFALSVRLVSQMPSHLENSLRK